MKTLLILVLSLQVFNLFGQSTYQYSSQAEFREWETDTVYHLWFEYNGMQFEIENFIGGSEFLEVPKSKYKEFDIPENTMSAVRVEFPDGTGSTELISYAIMKGNKLVVMGRYSVFPNIDMETFEYKEKVSLDF